MIKGDRSIDRQPDVECFLVLLAPYSDVGTIQEDPPRLSGGASPLVVAGVVPGFPFAHVASGLVCSTVGGAKLMARDGDCRALLCCAVSTLDGPSKG